MSTHLTVQPGPDAHVTAHCAPEMGSPPRILLTTGEGTFLSIYARGQVGVTAADVRFARALVAAAGEYLAACEALSKRRRARFLDDAEAPA
jgi:hypothetical protein